MTDRSMVRGHGLPRSRVSMYNLDLDCANIQTPLANLDIKPLARSSSSSLWRDVWNKGETSFNNRVTRKSAKMR